MTERRRTAQEGEEVVYCAAICLVLQRAFLHLFTVEVAPFEHPLP